MQDQFGEKVDLCSFNDEQYLQWPRRFMLGTIVNFKDQGLYAFELWPGDNMPPEGVIQCWKLLSASIVPASPLRFRACGASQEQVLRDALASSSTSKELKKDLTELLDVALIKTEDLFQAVVYQPLTIGTTIGTLRILRNVNTDPGQLLELSREDILVCDEVPNDLPPVRALITAQLQTPLCHVALLCSNRRAPNFAWKPALTNLASLEGKLVKLTCDMLECSVTEATSQDEAEWIKSPQGIRALAHANSALSDAKLKDIPFDDDVAGIFDISDMSDKAKFKAAEPAMGAKASQIVRLRAINLPEHCYAVINPAFVIPFHYYVEHLKHALPTPEGETESPLEALISKARSGMPTRELANALSEIQVKIIESTHFNSQLLDLVIDRITSQLSKPQSMWTQSGGAIFRSSTNVEDLPGFNGAGLYLSESVKKADLTNREKVAETIKRVWASVWTVRGFMERSEFGLNQSQVRMAILVMPFLDKTHVVANGVAITGNPFRSTFNAHYINSQVAGTAVTDNCAGTTSEQILVYDDDQPTPEILATSSLSKGQPILYSDEIVNVLFPIFKTLHRKFAIKKKEVGTGHAVDIEFLILNNDNRHLIILQCRPCTISYSLVSSRS